MMQVSQCWAAALLKLVKCVNLIEDCFFNLLKVLCFECLGQSVSFLDPFNNHSGIDYLRVFLVYVIFPVQG